MTDAGARPGRHMSRRVLPSRPVRWGAVALAALALAVVVAAPAVAFERRATERAVLTLVNQERAEHGLRPVRVSAVLSRVALAHSRDMLARQYFAHSALVGGTSRARHARRWAKWGTGEVIAMGQGEYGTPASVFGRWMRSRLHRGVILDPRWREAGVGCAYGTLLGIPGAVLYTIDFARRTR